MWLLGHMLQYSYIIHGRLLSTKLRFQRGLLHFYHIMIGSIKSCGMFVVTVLNSKQLDHEKYGCSSEQ